MFLNDLEDMYTEIGANGIDVYMSKLFMISYADYIVLFANSAGDLQFNLDILSHYCQRWKLLFNTCTSKTKVIVFRKSGWLSNDIKFSYNDMDLESVDKICLFRFSIHNRRFLSVSSEYTCCSIFKGNF